MGRKWKQADSFNEETPPRFASTQILSERISVEQEKRQKTELKGMSANADHQCRHSKGEASWEVKTGKTESSAQEK